MDLLWQKASTEIVSIFRSSRRKRGRSASNTLRSAARTWIPLPPSLPQVRPHVLATNPLQPFELFELTSRLIIVSLRSSWTRQGSGYKNHRRLGGFPDSRCPAGLGLWGKMCWNIHGEPLRTECFCPSRFIRWLIALKPVEFCRLYTRTLVSYMLLMLADAGGFDSKTPVLLCFPPSDWHRRQRHHRPRDPHRVSPCVVEVKKTHKNATTTCNCWFVKEQNMFNNQRHFELHCNVNIDIFSPAKTCPCQVLTHSLRLQYH